MMASKKTRKKAPAKNAKAATKDAVAQTTPKIRPASAEFTSDLTAVFQRHGWGGLPRELSFSLAGGPGRTCDDGSLPQPVWIDCPDGRRKVVYVCPGDDPTCDD
jgi:hypothetical protein